MAEFSGTSLFRIAGQYKEDGLDLVTPLTPVSFERPDTWSIGSALALYQDTLVLAVSTPQTIDLNALTDMYGNTVNFATVEALVIVNKGVVADTDLLSISGDFVTQVLIAGQSADTLTLPIRAQGTCLWTAPGNGYTVTAATADQITFDPGAKDFNVDLFIWGTSV